MNTQICLSHTRRFIWIYSPSQSALHERDTVTCLVILAEHHVSYKAHLVSHLFLS